MGINAMFVFSKFDWQDVLKHFYVKVPTKTMLLSQLKGRIHTLLDTYYSEETFVFSIGTALYDTPLF